MNAEPETVLNTLIVLGKFIYTWPLDSNCSKWLRIIHQLVYYFCCINEVATIILLLATVRYSILKGDHHIIIESLSHMASSADALLNWFFFKYQADDLNELLRIFTQYVKKANEFKKKILQKYMNNYLLVYPLTMILFFATGLSFICTPIFTERQFPIPFYFFSNIEKYSLSYYLIFSWQIWIINQSLVSVFMCLGIPILISMISTRLDMLALQFMNIENENQLKMWIQKHQKCIGHAKNINRILRFLVFKLYLAAMITIIFGALPILYYNNTIELIRATLYVGISLLLMYIVVWSADDMHKASLKISQELFNSEWINMPIGVRKSMIIIMCRAQKPLDISIPGILPTLTSNFYVKFLSYALSYIMTLRAVLL